MAKKEKSSKKEKAPKKLKKRKEPKVIEDIIASFLTVLLVLVGICNLFLAALIGFSYIKGSFNLEAPESSIVETAPAQTASEFSDPLPTM